jgi:GGDEF domain-containing protein
MRADDFLDDATRSSSADDFLDGVSAGPKAKPEPSLKDRIYSSANKLFRGGSVMDAIADQQTGMPFDPVATAAIDRKVSESRALPLPAQAPAVGILEKGVRGGIGQIAKSGLGAVQLAADALGADTVADMAAGGAKRANEFASNPLQKTQIEGFAPNSIVQDLPGASAGAISSVIANVPALVAGVAAPGAALPVMFGQSAAGEYSDGRADGLNSVGAALRAVPMGAAEVVGEKLGGFSQITRGIRSAIDEGSIVPMARAMISSGVREVPGEELTTALQFGIDKLPGVGTNQEATVGDLGGQMKQTALQTMLQSGGMVGVGTALNKADRQAPQAQPVDAPIMAAPAAPASVTALTDVINSTANIPSKLQTEAKPSADAFLDEIAAAAKQNPPVTRGDDSDNIGHAEVAPRPAVNSTEEVQNATDPASVEAVNAEVARAAGPDVNQPGAEVTNDTASTEQSVVDRPVEPAAARQDTAQAVAEQGQPKYHVPAQLTERATQLEQATEGLRPGDVVAADGKPFQTKAKAQVEAKAAGQGWTIKKGAGGFVVRYQPATEKQRANAARLVQQQSRVNPESDSMHMAIAKLGGINIDQLTKEWGYDPAEIKTLRHGIKRIGTANGMSLDRAGEALAELGYLSRDQHGKHDLSELFDLFDGELRRDPHYTPQGFERKMEGIKDGEYQAWLEQQDKDALNAQTDEQQAAIETILEEYDDISADEEAAIGREAIAAEPVGALGGTDQGSPAGAEKGIDGTAAQIDQQAPDAPGAGERTGHPAEGTGDVIDGRPERRQNPERRKTVSDMTPDEMRRALLVDELTGLGNRRAYVESIKKPYQASVDIDSLKWVNDNMGHESGDQLLALFGQALADETQDGYHLSGDEFAAQFDNEQEGRDLLERVRERLKGVIIEITHDDGSTTRKNGVEFSYGIDKTLRSADTKLLEDKARREAAGLRAGRGREPAGVSKTPAQGQSDNQGLPATQEVSPASRKGITPEAVNAAIAADTFNHTIDVYATLNDAPDHIQAQAKSEGETGVEGFWDPRSNRVALIAENLSSPERAVEVARHELIGHYGMKNMVGKKEMDRLADRVIIAELDGNKAIIDIAKYVDETQPNLPDQRRAREIIAVMAERNLQNSITKRVLDAIRKFLKSIGFTKKDLTDAEVAGLLRDAQAYLKKQGRAMVAGGPAQFSRAYHGSPHRFKKFSLDKIGTGEGAQVYGWGLYFAGKREVAEFYRKGLSTRDFINKAREAYDEYSSPDDAVEALLAIDGLSQSQKDLIEALQGDDWLGFDYPHQSISEAIKNPDGWDLSDRARAAVDKQGQLYEVSIPDDREYLLWDKPLSEQPENIRKVLPEIGVKARGHKYDWKPSLTMGEAYRQMAADFADELGAERGQEAASKALAAAGIAGIKYLDGSSRSNGDGSFNYVVFDDSRVAVEKTYYSRKPVDERQQELDIEDGSPREPIRARDFVSTERDVSGRRRWVAGKKGYDRLVDAINPLLAKVKLSNDAPDAFKQMMRQFAVDQNKALENAKRVAEVGTETLTPEERILISDIIEKNVAAGDLPPENVAKIAADIGAALKHQAQELVDLGMASPERLLENYLPRAYRNPLLARLTNKEMFVSWYQKAKLRMNGNRLKSRGLVHTVGMNDIEKYQKLGWTLSSMSDGTDIPDDLWDAIQTKGKIPPQYAQDLKFLMWRDFTEDERAKMGEIRDGILRYAMGYTETQRDIAIGRLFKSIAENDELSSAINPGGWTRVPDQEVPGTGGLKRYGALSGLFVPPYVRDVIERSTQPKGPLMQMYDKALSFWKEGKTVWNPVSHGNNVVSNVFVMHFAGLNPADPRHWRNTVREYRTKGQYYVEGVDNGLFGTEFASKDIQELFLPDLTDELDVETVVASRFNKVVESLKKAGKPVSWYRDRMQKAYEFEDQFFKLMIYADRRKAGASIEDAIADTERYIFNYSDIPEGVELAKRAYSPFISYTYKALPMLVHTAMTRPDRLLLPIALLGGANWLAYAITGGDEEKERKGMPEYMDGRSAIGTPKAVRMPFNIEDRPAFMDISRRVPLGDLFDLTNQTGGLAVPAPLMPSHPLFTATAALLFNLDTFTGKPITQKSDTGWEEAQKRANWAWKQMVPNAPFVPGSWNFDKLMNGAANAFDTEMMGYTGYTKAGDPIKLSTALLDVSTGTKIRSFDPEHGIDFKRFQLKKEHEEIQANIRSAARNKSMTPDARRDYIDRQREKMTELAKKQSELK